MYASIIQIVTILSTYFPHLQAVYIFGSWGTDEAWPDSDVDVAVLLHQEEARESGSFALSDAKYELELILGRNVDLINLRQVDTVLQKEVVSTGKRLYCGDEYAADFFEMLTLSFYQKLNEERAQIVQEIINSGRIYNSP